MEATPGVKVGHMQFNARQYDAIGALFGSLFSVTKRVHFPTILAKC